MAKTREQKKQEVQENAERFKGSAVAIFADFSGLSANAANALRKSLQEIGAGFSIMKKRLLKIAGREAGVEIHDSLEGQIGVVFSPRDITETAQAVYKFHKGAVERFKIRGAVALDEKRLLSADEVIAIGKLPSREVLLGQLVLMIVAPIRSFMFVLNERAKKQ